MYYVWTKLNKCTDIKILDFVMKIILYLLLSTCTYVLCMDERPDSEFDSEFSEMNVVMRQLEYQSQDSVSFFIFDLKTSKSVFNIYKDNLSTGIPQI